MTAILGPAIGISIATVRTARNLFWAAVGMLMLMGMRTER